MFRFFNVLCRIVIRPVHVQEIKISAVLGPVTLHAALAGAGVTISQSSRANVRRAGLRRISKTARNSIIIAPPLVQPRREGMAAFPYPPGSSGREEEVACPPFPNRSKEGGRVVAAASSGSWRRRRAYDDDDGGCWWCPSTSPYLHAGCRLQFVDLLLSICILWISCRWTWESIIYEFVLWMKWLIVCISLGNLSKIWIQSQNFLSLKLGFGSLVSFFLFGKKGFH